MQQPSATLLEAVVILFSLKFTSLCIELHDVLVCVVKVLAAAGATGVFIGFNGCTGFEGNRSGLLGLTGVRIGCMGFKTGFPVISLAVTGLAVTGFLVIGLAVTGLAVLNFTGFEVVEGDTGFGIGCRGCVGTDGVVI